MNSQINIITRIKRLSQVLVIGILLFWLTLATLENFTANSIKTPISATSLFAKTQVISPSLNIELLPSTSSNPVATAFIQAIPSSDGAEVFVSATGINAAGSSVILNVNPGIGGGAHEDSNAMTLSGTTYIATATGFAPGQDTGTDGDDTMSITTTVGSQVMGTGDINFQRAFVPTDEKETIIVDNGAFTIDMPNLNTLPADAYVLVMSTNMVPGALPVGYQFASNSYNVSPSGALTQSDRFMTLQLTFPDPLPNNADTHTLAVVGWDQAKRQWEILSGDLLDDNGDMDDKEDQVEYVTKRFRIYALAITPTWRDTFKLTVSPSGISEMVNIKVRASQGGRVVLADNVMSGTVTSSSITPVKATRWGTLHFSATTDINTGVVVDVLDASNNSVLIANAQDGADLSTLPISTSLKLRATLSTTTPSLGPALPKLHQWSASWVPQEFRVYLPLVIK